MNASAETNELSGAVSLGATAGPNKNVLDHIHAWLVTVDHKKLGLMYIMYGLFFFVVAGIEAALIRIQLVVPNNHFLTPQIFNQLFTMHGTTMVFLVGMPLIFGFANYLVPLMIGARDLAFPRLNAFGFWLSVFGGLLLYFSFIGGDGMTGAGGAPDVGWFAYAPLTGRAFSKGHSTDYWILGILVGGFGSIATAANVIATILCMRCRGMTLTKMPLLVWLNLIMCGMVLVTISPLTAAQIMLLLDRFVGSHFFDTQAGGSAALWMHFFWIFGHPEVYILVIPAFAIASEVIPVFSRKAIFGYPAMVGATIAIAFRGLVAGLRHQLHPSWLSCALVSAIGIIHVPVSRRRVLCRWRPCLGPAAARSLQIRLQNRKWGVMDQSWPGPDSGLAAESGLRQSAQEVLMRLIKDLGNWFDQRLQLGKPLKDTMAHPVPRRAASWAYVFGSASLTIMVLQFLIGICLAFVYVPAADQAWTSLQVLNHQQSFGCFIRALHGWGSDFMVALVLIHMVQVFMFGAYKFPRELTWMVGVCLLLMTLGMAFTGQVLRFDQDAYWGLGIGASVMGRMPFIGTPLVHSMLGGPIIAGETLSRFFAIHVFIIPGALIAFVGVHLLMVLKLGVNEWPMPGRIVKRETYLKEYHELTQKQG